MLEVIRVYDGQKFSDYAAAAYKSFSIGAGPGYDYNCTGSDPDRLNVTFFKQDADWYAETSCHGNREQIRLDINDGEKFILSGVHHQLAMLFQVDPQKTIKKDFTDGAVTLGRLDDNDIVLPLSSVSRHHARFEYENGKCYIEDLGSKEGTYLNGRLIAERNIVEPGDVVSIETWHFTFDGRRIISSIPDSLLKEQEMARITNRPYFKRSPRISAIPHEKIMRIEPPPGIGGDPQFYWSLSLIGMAASGLRFVTGKARHKKQYKILLEKYNAYLEAIRKEMDEHITLRRSILLMEHPSIDECIAIGREHSRRMWERNASDEDFMSLRIGIGSGSSELIIDAPGSQFALMQDPLVEAAKKLAAVRERMDNIPVTAALTRGNTLGIMGNKADISRILNNMIVEAAALHSCDELKIVTLFSEDDAEDRAWIRWLPHSFSNSRDIRYMACEREDAVELGKYFSDVLRYREDALKERSGNAAYRDPLPFYLFVVTDQSLLERSPLLKYLLDNREGMGIGVIFTGETLWHLPKECRTIIEANGNGSVIYDRADSLNKQQFTPDMCEKDRYEAFARDLAPVALDTALEATAAFPSSLTFLSGYGVKRPNQLPILENWMKHDADTDMAVPIGMMENGEPFLFDIMSGHHGPHGVVVGTTGSGKTEAIQAWILSMCVRFSPEDISFVLVDFKGTGLLDPFKELPHLAGTISNLDNGISRNLVALASELERRQQLFSELDVNKISKYNRIAKKRLPYLFVIFDEFADFKRNFPDEMQTISRFYEQGRSLGMWFILMSQKPDPLTAFIPNAEFKWCLRVKESDASKLMLGTSDAARMGLPPGRTFVTAGNGAVYEEIQTFFSGAPYRPYQKNQALKVAPISAVDIMGRRMEFADDATTSGVRSGKSEIDVVVERIAEVAKENNIPHSPQVWNEPLPERLGLDRILEGGFDGNKWPEAGRTLASCVGLTDDPQKQSRYAYKPDLTEDGSIAVVGAPSSGKTIFMETMIMSLAMGYSPADVNMYILDFGGGALNVFSQLPHVGGIAVEDEDEKIGKLTKLLTDRIVERKKLFAAAGVTNIRDYMDVSGEHLPFTVLFIDRIEAALQRFPDMDKTFQGLISTGSNYGIYVVLSASNILGMTYKISQNIKTKIALHLNDPTDYSGLVGKTGGLIPADTPGRGLVNVGYVVEMQTALPWKGSHAVDLIKGIREQCAKMADAWQEERPAQIPVMPEYIPYGSVGGKGVTIGISYDDMQALCLDPDKKHSLLISGTTGSGKSTLLSVICRQMHEKGADIILFDSVFGGFEDIAELAKLICIDGGEMDEYLEELAAELKRRKEIKDSGNTMEFTPLVIAIDDLAGCFDQISNQSAKRLEMLVKLGKGLGVYLFAAGSLSDVSRLYSMGESLTMTLLTLGYGVALGDKFVSHTMYNIKMPYSKKNELLDEHDGYLVDGDTAVKFKMMNKE